MKKYFHKIATYTAFIVISAQPISTKAFASEKEPNPSISIVGDDDYFAQTKTTSNPERVNDAVQDVHYAATPFETIKHLSEKFAQIVAWVNSDIEADLH